MKYKAQDIKHDEQGQWRKRAYLQLDAADLEAWDRLEKTKENWPPIADLQGRLCAERKYYEADRVWWIGVHDSYAYLWIEPECLSRAAGQAFAWGPVCRVVGHRCMVTQRGGLDI